MPNHRQPLNFVTYRVRHNHLSTTLDRAPRIFQGPASEIRAQYFPDVRIILAPPPTNFGSSRRLTKLPTIRTIYIRMSMQGTPTIAGMLGQLHADSFLRYIQSKNGRSTTIPTCETKQPTEYLSSAEGEGRRSGARFAELVLTHRSSVTHAPVAAVARVEKANSSFQAQRILSNFRSSAANTACRRRSEIDKVTSFAQPSSNTTSRRMTRRVTAFCGSNPPNLPSSLRTAAGSSPHVGADVALLTHMHPRYSLAHPYAVTGNNDESVFGQGLPTDPIYKSETARQAYYYLLCRANQREKVAAQEQFRRYTYCDYYWVLICLLQPFEFSTAASQWKGVMVVVVPPYLRKRSTHNAVTESPIFPALPINNISRLNMLCGMCPIAPPLAPLHRSAEWIKEKRSQRQLYNTYTQYKTVRVTGRARGDGINRSSLTVPNGSERPSWT
ncbi:hypothetical protein EDD16DRAFT_1515460 [Pisolithus croceorrhizus]|nr:hypothetical protein EDD16DRAFT_1515460 [Pisolithus croceorrhizus]KAI6163208.1 hypothetical protein EDD17DRAFT_1507592 [Pisolithus thermaeus]